MDNFRAFVNRFAGSGGNGGCARGERGEKKAILLAFRDGKEYNEEKREEVFL